MFDGFVLAVPAGQDISSDLTALFQAFAEDFSLIPTTKPWANVEM